MKTDKLIDRLQSIEIHNQFDREIYCLDRNGHAVPVKAIISSKESLPFKDKESGWGGVSDDKVWLIIGEWEDAELFTR